jgi:3-dehydroquinate synthase
MNPHDIELKTKQSRCLIRIADDMSSLANLVNGRQALVICDDSLPDFQLPENWPVTRLRSDESTKSPDGVTDLYRLLLAHQLDRESIVIAVGGGALCDAVGFAAATFMRGIAVGFCPTTLLAQTDAAIGGKSAINVDGIKNVAGLIRQPEFVLDDINFLIDLPENLFSDGLAEVVKHAVIADAGLFEFLENSAAALLARGPDALTEMLARSIRIKIDVVEKDETELGIRRVLNFGHSFGHAYEVVGDLSHGRAVALGMLRAAQLSVSWAGFSENAWLRLKHLLDCFGLPTDPLEDSREIISLLAKDKKRSGSFINLVLLSKLGEARVHRIALDKLQVS